MYKEQFGDLLVPTNFTFYNESTFLGHHMNYLRRVEKTHPHMIRSEERDESNRMGFIWDVNEMINLVKALKTFNQLNATNYIPYKFVVPFHNTQWDESLWGLRLGEVYCIKKYGGFSEWELQQLKSIGWVAEYNIDIEKKSI